jgi:hypothetical protein
VPKGEGLTPPGSHSDSTSRRNESNYDQERVPRRWLIIRGGATGKQNRP